MSDIVRGGQSKEYWEVIQPSPWYVDEYQPGQFWIRRDAGDGAIETLCQDVETKEGAEMVVRALNSYAVMLAAIEAAHDNDPNPQLEEAIAVAKSPVPTRYFK